MEKRINIHSSEKDDAYKNQVRGKPPEKEEAQGFHQELTDVRNWLKQVRFKKSIFGGVKEADVWKKIGELNTLYEAALAKERVRYDVLLEERIQTSARQMALEMLRQAGHPPEQMKAGDDG